MPNLLASTTSPYLLQHADNPVAWHPWDTDAFARAKSEGKPVFLSIGYSTCHWCHVMAHESFENPDVAAVLNEYFVSIKVDREERPDVDRLYMAFVQATTGSGGWPMSVWLTPDGAPFFGGTYFPPTDRYGRPGFVTVLERIAELWATERPGILHQAAGVIASLRETIQPSVGGTLTADDAVLRAGFDAFAASYDPMFGGFGGGPKFPRPSIFNFLLAWSLRAPADAADKAREMTFQTLRHMASGGLYDHLGGGFHRYSVDGEWHVPHFEKMLYDQAQLVNSYVDAWQITGDEFFATVARETLAYVTSDLSHPAGGFYSAEDADSLVAAGRPEHGEGVFYVWSFEELSALLGDDTALFAQHYGAEPGGNVDPTADPHGEFPGKNILTQRLPIRPEDSERLAHCRRVLFAVREQRPRPHLDDKVLTAWNGLMISAFARAGAVLGDDTLIDRARSAAEFLHAELWDGTTLYRSWRGTRAPIAGFAEDYAFLIQGLLDLYEADFDSKNLTWALELQTRQDALFADPDGGGYFGSAADDPLVPVRTKDDHDGAEPSASSISVRNLLRLAAMMHDETFADRARGILVGFDSILRRVPGAVPQMLAALDLALTPPRQAVIAGARGTTDTRDLAAHARREYQPHQVLLLADSGPGQSLLSRHSDAVASMTPVNGRAALYLCENFTCSAPITNPQTVSRPE